MSRTVRTTINPGEELHVSDAEYLDLQRQGLIHDEPEAPAASSPDKARKPGPGGLPDQNPKQ